MARRKRKFLTCEKNKYRFITPSLCAVCPHLEKCKAFPEYYIRNKRLYQTFIKETTSKFPEKYKMEVVFMATKQMFIQIVDKKTGKIEEVVEKAQLDAMDIEKKISLTRGKELYIVTHKIEPVIKIEMKPTKITEPIQYSDLEKMPSIEIDEAKGEEVKAKTTRTRRKSTTSAEETAPKTTKGRRKKTT
jgi:hypothetical protein